MNVCETCDNAKSFCENCYDCYELITKIDIHLIPGVINEIEISNPNYLDPRFIIEILHQNLRKTSWWIINSFNFFDPHSKTVRLAIVVTKPVTIQQGHPICHFRFVSIKNILQENKGKLNF